MSVFLINILIIIFSYQGAFAQVVSSSGDVSVYCSKGKVFCANGKRAKCKSGYFTKCVRGTPQLTPECCKKKPNHLSCRRDLFKCKKGEPPSIELVVKPTCINGEIICQIGTPSCVKSTNLGTPTCLTVFDEVLPGCLANEGFFAEEATCNK